MDRDGWASHKWSSPQGHRIESNPVNHSFNITVPDASGISPKTLRPVNDTPFTCQCSAF